MTFWVRSIRIVDWLVFGAFAFVFYAFYAGFGDSSPRMAILSGCCSCIFWLAASALPIYWARLRADTEMVNALNAFAAGATGAAVLSATSKGWYVLLGATT